MPVYLASVVDDMAIASPDPAYTKQIIAAVLAEFEGTHMGIVKHYNGMRVVWLDNGRRVMLLQPAHIDKLVDLLDGLADMSRPQSVPMKPGLRLCRSGTSEQTESPLLDTSKYPYRALVGGLNYIACCTRPDITFAVNQLARYSNAPTEAHWAVAVGCLRYLKGTKWWGIVLGDSGVRNPGDQPPPKPCQYLKLRPDPSEDAAGACDPPPLPSGQDCVAYADANHGTGIDDRRSVNGTLLQVLGGPVSWSSHVQPTQSVSTVESEIHAMSEASREALWVAKLAKEFGIVYEPFLVRGDSAGALAAVTKYTYTRHAKHIGIHQDFMRDRYQQGQLSFEHIRGVQNPADIFTKALPLPAFRKHRANIGMLELPADLR
jgi:hypothetical protein